MITARSLLGLHGLGDLGMKVPMSPLQGPPEDSLIMGLGASYYRHRTFLGIDQLTPGTKIIQPIAREPARISTALTPPTYIAPQPKLPLPPTPRADTATTVPGEAGIVTKQEPPTLVPSGRAAYWPQTEASPTPLQPPVEMPNLPPTPEGDQTFQYPPTDESPPAGPQAQVGGDALDVAQQQGQVMDASAPTDWWQWVKDNKGKIGIGAGVLVGAIVLVKVLR